MTADNSRSEDDSRSEIDLRFESITQGVFDDAEIGYMQHELEHATELRRLRFNTEQILDEGSAKALLAADQPRFRKCRRKLMEELVEKVDIEVGGRLLVDNVSSVKLEEYESEGWVFGSGQLPYVVGLFGGLALGRWYDYPVGEIPSSKNEDSSLWRDGFSLELRDAHMYDELEGFTELDICFVALNHGKPLLYQVLPASTEFENPQH